MLSYPVNRSMGIAIGPPSAIDRQPTSEDTSEASLADAKESQEKETAGIKVHVDHERADHRCGWEFYSETGNWGLREGKSFTVMTASEPGTCARGRESQPADPPRPTHSPIFHRQGRISYCRASARYGSTVLLLPCPCDYLALLLLAMVRGVYRCP